MVNIVYITRLNFFSDKAHVRTITKTCEALSLLGDINLTLVSTDNSLNDTSLLNQFFSRYSVKNPFKIISLNSISNYFKNSSNFFVYNIGTILANLSLGFYVLQNRHKFEVLYLRDHLLLPVFLFTKYVLRKKTVYESHYVLTKKFGQYLTEVMVKKSDAIIAIAGTLRDYYLKFNKNTTVAFCTSSEKQDFQVPLNISKNQNEYRLVYTGNIDVTGNGDSYGVEDVLNALPYMQKDIHFYAIGKKTNGVHQLELMAEGIGVSNRFHCLPWMERRDAIQYILSADILIIPKSGAKLGNSPTKMFEYLATGKPIVAANTEAISEILINNINALLVDYSDQKSWAGAVLKIRNNKEFSDKLVTQALKDADLYTWDSRAFKIAEVIKNLC